MRLNALNDELALNEEARVVGEGRAVEASAGDGRSATATDALVGAPHATDHEHSGANQDGG